MQKEQLGEMSVWLGVSLVQQKVGGYPPRLCDQGTSVGSMETLQTVVAGKQFYRFLILN